MLNAILVDDEPRTVEALKKNVNWKQCGIEKTYQAMSMDGAIKLLETEPIDILICDIEMPNGSGLQLLEYLREKNMELPCIFVTCHPEFDYMRKAIQLRCYDYILKPIQYDKFEQVLVKLTNQLEEKKVPTQEEVLQQEVMEERHVERERNVEEEVKRYVKEHLVENITVTDIAEELHYNPQYLMRAFKGKTNLSIMEYITQTRMEAAKTILKGTNLPIKEVSYMVGYADYAYFTRVFRKEVGIAPSQYRNEK